MRLIAARDSFVTLWLGDCQGEMRTALIARLNSEDHKLLPEDGQPLHAAWAVLLMLAATPNGAARIPYSIFERIRTLLSSPLADLAGELHFAFDGDEPPG